jgi:DNA-binding SARP family transcriptional activator
LVEFLLLGPLEVVRDTEPVVIRGARQRALLACLLLNAGRPVPAEELVRCLWGADAEAGVAHALHEAVSKLRRTLDGGGLGGLIETPGGGSYLLNVDDDMVDSRRFERLADAGFAESEPGTRAELLRAALGLWRAPALVDVLLECEAGDERDRLDELRLAVAAEWIKAEVQLGHDARVIPELKRLAQAHPLHEGLREQLMLALYREGRQAEALHEYQDARRVLTEELGLEPSARLRDLERAILRHEPALLATVRRAGAAFPLRVPGGRHRASVALAGAVLLAGGLAVLLSFGSAKSNGAVLADSLKGAAIDTQTWDIVTLGKGVAVAPTARGVLMTIPAHAIPTDGTQQMKARLATYCVLAGPFDVQVDYALRAWPRVNGVTVGMYAAFANLVRESDARRGEEYVGNVSHFDPPDRAPNKRLPTRDTSGTLRITRAVGRITEQVATNGNWQTVYTAASTLEYPAAVYLEAWTNERRFAHREVDVEFSNFRVNDGIITCPYGIGICCPGASGT